MIRITTQKEGNRTIVTIDGQAAEADLGEIRRVRKSMKGEVFLNLRGLDACAGGGVRVLQEWLGAGARLQAATPFLEMLLKAPPSSSARSHDKETTDNWQLISKTMKTNTVLTPLLLAALALSGAFAAEIPAHAPAVDPAATSTEEIRRTAMAFVAAFHKGDVKALAGFWTPDGDYTDLGGRLLKGRDAIQDDFADLFSQNKGLTLRIEVGSLRFPTPDTAIEDGVTSVMSPTAATPNRARYTNFLVKRDGKWLLASVREANYIPPNHQDHLRPLEWMIGEWKDQTTNGHTAHVVFEWSPDLNFILSVRVVRVEGTFLDNGTQRIGWDPSAKLIRSWNFEPDGGFGDSTWSAATDGRWIVKANSVLRSGHKASATTVVTRVDPDTITFQVRDQKADGKPLPDSATITMKRVN